VRRCPDSDGGGGGGVACVGVGAAFIVDVAIGADSPVWCMSWFLVPDNAKGTDMVAVKLVAGFL
jgi:hypothetical protein